MQEPRRDKPDAPAPSRGQVVRRERKSCLSGHGCRPAVLAGVAFLGSQAAPHAEGFTDHQRPIQALRTDRAGRADGFRVSCVRVFVRTAGEVGVVEHRHVHTATRGPDLPVQAAGDRYEVQGCAQGNPALSVVSVGSTAPAMHVMPVAAVIGDVWERATRWSGFSPVTPGITWRHVAHDRKTGR